MGQVGKNVEEQVHVFYHTNSHLGVSAAANRGLFPLQSSSTSRSSVGASARSSLLNSMFLLQWQMQIQEYSKL